MTVKHFEEYDYVYNDNNNLVEVYENKNLICRYSYNSKSQLIREDNLMLEASIVYEFNNLGKLAKRIVYDFSLANLQNVKHVDVFTYDANNSNKIIAYNDEYFKYDNKDNFTVFRNSKLNFSSSNNLVNLDFYKFKYDKQNNRKIKTVGRTKTKYYRKDNKLLKQKNKNTLLFIYKDDKIIGFKFKKNKYFYKKNINEDIIGIYDSNKKLICKYSYDCLGNHKLFVSETNYEIADINPFRFHSYYYDIESGLYHINGKYYDSEINCFLNA